MALFQARIEAMYTHVGMESNVPERHEQRLSAVAAAQIACGETCTSEYIQYTTHAQTYMQCKGLTGLQLLVLAPRKCRRPEQRRTKSSQKEGRTRRGSRLLCFCDTAVLASLRRVRLCIKKYRRNKASMHVVSSHVSYS